MSEPVAKAMAEGAQTRSGAAFALAISGIAGPDGGTPAKPVGTVCIALAAARAERRVRTIVFTGDREMVRDRSAKMALTLLRFHLLGSRSHFDATRRASIPRPLNSLPVWQPGMLEGVFGSRSQSPQNPIATSKRISYQIALFYNHVVHPISPPVTARVLLMALGKDRRRYGSWYRRIRNPDSRSFWPTSRKVGTRRSDNCLSRRACRRCRPAAAGRH